MKTNGLIHYRLLFGLAGLLLFIGGIVRIAQAQVQGGYSPPYYETDVPPCRWSGASSSGTTKELQYVIDGSVPSGWHFGVAVIKSDWNNTSVPFNFTNIASGLPGWKMKLQAGYYGQNTNSNTWYSCAGGNVHDNPVISINRSLSAVESNYNYRRGHIGHEFGHSMVFGHISTAGQPLTTLMGYNPDPYQYVTPQSGDQQTIRSAYP